MTAALDAPWMHHPGTRAVFDALGAHQVLFVGGCVRNGLLGRPVDDIDIATDARPETVMDLARAHGLKPVPTGVDHGTVTVVAAGKAHEVTTFRRDVATDGRHARVAFATDMAQDAARRDFTMNALYASIDGTVHDPNGRGLSDLGAGRIRFIGTAADRVREDYLRILRFFRFHAWYAAPGTGLDPDGLDAAARHADGLAGISRERIGAEMKKLLAAPDPAPAVAAMQAAGVLAHVLPGADARLLAPLVHLEAGVAEAGQGTAPPIRRLAALGGQDPAPALRLSGAEAKRLAVLIREQGTATGAGELGYRHGADIARDILLLRATTGPVDLTAAQAAADRGARAHFPVKAADLMPHFTGPDLGHRLTVLENRWIASDFTLDKATLLATP